MDINTRFIKRLFTGVTILLMVTPGNTILPSFSSLQTSCIEKNLKLTCECNHLVKTLSVPSFRLLNVHANIDRITIKNCQNVTIGSHSIEHLTSLRYFEITNVENLYLSSYSLSWKGYENLYPYDLQTTTTPSLIITISQTRILNVEQYAITGKPIELKFNQVQFDQIQSFAFSSLSKMLIIEIKNCIFKQISMQAFKKIETDKLIIGDSKFIGTLPSRAFTDLDVLEEFKIINSHFEIINPTAFIIKLPKHVDIINSRFDVLPSECFMIRSRGLVTIKNCQFKNINENAFNSISFIKEHRAIANQELIFEQNTFSNLKTQYLNFNRTSFNPKYGSIIVNETCDCLNVEIWISNNEWKEHIQCVIDFKKYTTKKVIDFKGSTCDTGTSVWIILVSVFSALLILLIIVAVVIVFLYRRYKKNKEKEYVNRGRTKNGSLGIIVPDGRTYRETEVHVIVEKAELLTTEL